MKDTEAEIKEKKEDSLNIKKIINVIIIIVMSIILIYNITIIIKSYKNKNETPSFLGIKTYVILSGSMEPELNIGDVIISKKVEESELHEGDIISFRANNSIVTHRIIGINESEGKKNYTTKGDNNNTEDLEKVTFDKIEGRFVCKIPKIGNITFFLRNKVVLIIAFLLILLLIYHNGTQCDKT